MNESEYYAIAGSAYRALKHVVDVLNEHELVKGKFVIHYPKVIQVDDNIYLTSIFDDDIVARIMRM